MNDLNEIIIEINLVYIETLLYIVHVDDIEISATANDEVTEEMYDGGDEQPTTSSNTLVRRMSKRTTASFNERHQTSQAPIYARPTFSFANPLRRLNSKINTYFSLILFKFIFIL